MGVVKNGCELPEFSKKKNTCCSKHEQPARAYEVMLHMDLIP